MSNETEGTEETEEWEFSIPELREAIKQAKMPAKVYGVKEHLLKICDVLEKMENYYDTLIDQQATEQITLMKDYLKTHRHLPDGTVVRTV